MFLASLESLFHTGGVFASMSITFGTAFGGNGPAPMLGFVAGGFGGEGT